LKPYLQILQDGFEKTISESIETFRTNNIVLYELLFSIEEREKSMIHERRESR